MHATGVAVGGPGFCLPACIGRSESVRRESRRAVGRGTFPRGIAWYWAVHPDRPLTRSHHMATKKAAKKKPAAKKAVKKSAAKRSEEHTSELQSLMRISYAVFCLKKKKSHKK